MTTKADLLSTARLRLDDSETPYLWSDTELTTYLQDAEREATERAELLPVEGVSTYCTIAIVALTAIYAANPLVYEIKKARIVGENLPLKRTSRETLDRQHMMWEDETGVPREYFFTLSGEIRLYPCPVSSGSLELAVLRFPIATMGTSPEINARYHIQMLDWAYRQAYLKRGIDTYNVQQSQYFENLFEKTFGPKKDYRTQERQLRHTPKEMPESCWP